MGYNAWGELVYAYAHNGAENTTARYNTIFYRGYYFDSDLYLYYLTTRYYDPYIGRFISPDDISYLGANGDLNGFNLYAYCSNNPTVYRQTSNLNSNLNSIGMNLMPISKSNDFFVNPWGFSIGLLTDKKYEMPS